ncbi:MAG: hypothetical protein ACFCUI_00095 [Bernardetiaceae bacterium]
MKKNRFAPLFFGLLTFGTLCLTTACQDEPRQEEAVTQPEVTEPDPIPTADQAEQPILNDMGKWKAIEDFHMEMGMTYHTAIDENNMAVVKENAAAMAASAQALAAATPTPEFDNDTVKEHIRTLVDKTGELANLVAGEAPDEEVKQLLNAIHDAYHALEKAKQAKE